MRQADTAKLAQYVERCLTSPFLLNSGFVFQDLANELGRRLDYEVSNGRYRGVQNVVGADGIWISPEGQTIVAEVKTTDAYTVKMDVIANYRTRLQSSNEISPPSSVLIVVGRQDTGELEAQTAVPTRMGHPGEISAEVLLKLVQLKENSEEPETGPKIRSLLTPMEFTRLDGLVDVMFTTAIDVEAGIVEATIEGDETGAVQDPDRYLCLRRVDENLRTARFSTSKPNAIIDALSQKIGAKLIRKSRALYWDASHENRVACSISKRYSKGAAYWYAYHPKWDESKGSPQRLPRCAWVC